VRGCTLSVLLISCEGRCISAQEVYSLRRESQIRITKPIRPRITVGGNGTVLTWTFVQPLWPQRTRYKEPTRKTMIQRASPRATASFADTPTSLRADTDDHHSPPPSRQRRVVVLVRSFSSRTASLHFRSAPVPNPERQFPPFFSRTHRRRSSRVHRIPSVRPTPPPS